MATEFEVRNPATDEVVGCIPECSKVQLDNAVKVALEAFRLWRVCPIAKRREYVAAMGGVLETNVGALKALLTQEHGKTYEDSVIEILDGARWTNEISKLDFPCTGFDDTSDSFEEIVHIPMGVVGVILPRDCPVMVAMMKISTALMAGCTVVLKPSPFSSLTILKIGELLRGVLPAGVVNIVTGGEALGEMITSHPVIAMVSFTGSTKTGRKIMATAGLKRLTLGLGGNNAAIILPDVNVNKITEALFWSAFRSSNQECFRTRRMYVHSDLYEPLKAALVVFAAGVKMGNGAKNGTQLGPLSNKAQFERAVALIDDCKAMGLSFAVGGDVPLCRGYFVPVTIVDNPPEGSRVVQEEQCGPVLPLIKFTNVDDVISKVNLSCYGLGASIWTSNVTKGLQLSKKIQSGTVWINETGYVTPSSVIGGHKQSGIGLEGGLEGLLSFTKKKIVLVNKKKLSMQYTLAESTPGVANGSPVEESLKAKSIVSSTSGRNGGTRNVRWSEENLVQFSDDFEGENIEALIDPIPLDSDQVAGLDYREPVPPFVNKLQHVDVSASLFDGSQYLLDFTKAHDSQIAVSNPLDSIGEDLFPVTEMAVSTVVISPSPPNNYAGEVNPLNSPDKREQYNPCNPLFGHDEISLFQPDGSAVHVLPSILNDGEFLEVIGGINDALTEQVKLCTSRGMKQITLTLEGNATLELRWTCMKTYSLDLATVTSIYKGKNKFPIGTGDGADENRCLSIISQSTSLDLELNSEVNRNMAVYLLLRVIQTIGEKMASAANVSSPQEAPLLASVGAGATPHHDKEMEIVEEFDRLAEGCEIGKEVVLFGAFLNSHEVQSTIDDELLSQNEVEEAWIAGQIDKALPVDEFIKTRKCIEKTLDAVMCDVNELDEDFDEQRSEGGNTESLFPTSHLGDFSVMAAPSLKIFETVVTTYGIGFIKAICSNCYVIQLTEWRQDQGQSPILYLQEEAMCPIPGVMPGLTVSTIFGVAKVEAVRPDGVHIAHPVNWMLANQSRATLYLHGDSVKLFQTPDLLEGDEVMTVFGQGYIAEKRQRDVVVKLRSWALAQGQSPTLYLSHTACVKIPGVKLGSILKTVWGLVRLLIVRRSGIHECEAVHWDLATGKPPILFLSPEAFFLLSANPMKKCCTSDADDKPYLQLGDAGIDNLPFRSKACDLEAEDQFFQEQFDLLCAGENSLSLEAFLASEAVQNLLSEELCTIDELHTLWMQGAGSMTAVNLRGFAKISRLLDDWFEFDSD